MLHNAAASEPLPLQRSSREGELPLSFAQQRLWFIDQFERASALYSIPRVFRIRGAPDVTALERGLNEIVCRHEVLRTTFPTVEGKPVQRISSSLILSLPVIDLTDRPSSEREEEALRLTDQEVQLGFDLARGPLLRATLFRLDPEDHVLLLTMHHIVSDGWSMEVLLRELSTLYHPFPAGKPSSLAELPIQYADFAVWQRQWLQGEVLDSQVRYWKKQLAGAPLVLELPTDRVRPTAQTFRGARQAMRLPRELTEAVKRLSRSERVTLFMTLLAAFQTLLHRHTGQDNILVGFPVANRTLVKIEPLIGFFVNTLVLRAEFSRNQTFRQLLGRVRNACLDAYAHQDLPFEKLVEELQPDRDLSRNPLFQVMFQFRNLPSEALRLPGLTIEGCEYQDRRAKFDLTLDIEESAGGLLCMFTYNSDLFDENRIKRMAGNFQTLLEAIVTDPEQRLSDLPLLTDTERHRLLVQWNETKRDYPQDVSLQRLFELQVKRTPEATAVVFEDQRLTYRELNGRANRLAHYLRALGVGPEVLVGICVERSLDIVVGLLGIVKAGGAYVPLDPGYPLERLDFMMQDTRSPVVLTQQRLLQNLPGSAAKLVCLDGEWREIAEGSEENPIDRTAPENLAYVIYTSGSTGRPKGVLIEHRQILNYVKGIGDRCNLKPHSGFAMVQPLSVDSSQTVIFPSLISGGCLHVIPEDKSADPQALGRYFSRLPIDILKIAPSHLAALQNSPHPEGLLPGHSLIIGGEAFHTDWVEKLQSIAGNCTIFNHYGPTETTVGVLTYQTRRNQSQPRTSTIPIGRPLPNTQVYLLDHNLQPVPIGVPGELYIGGQSLARGYLDRPEITAEKFIPNPFSNEPGTRLYKTGDLGRYLADGNIEFLGRTDHQVKIRGFRIELGEIEAVLEQHPAVRERIVLAREDTPADKRLVAYVVPHPELSPSTSELRSYLKEKLPEYMVPSAFMLLETLPRTPHGKVDRRALPAPDQTRSETEETFVPPRTPVEKVLAGIWTEVLGIKQVGIRDNFFDLGGHSLKATQVISRMRQAFKMDLSVRILFENPTIEELVQVVAETQTEEAKTEELNILFRS